MSGDRAGDPLSGLAETLEDAQVEYALIGGHAVNVWLEPRFTADIDLTLQAGAATTARLKSALAEAGFALADEHGGEGSSGPDFLRFRSSDRLVTLEIQTAKTEFQREVIRRARSHGSSLRVATVEDLIVLKLIADRAKDQVDLQGLVRLPRIDWGYVERWAQAWDVQDRLARLRAAP